MEAEVSLLPAGCGAFVRSYGTDQDLYAAPGPEEWIADKESFLGRTIRDAGIREKWHCLVAGVEKVDGALHTPDLHIPFEEGDVLWIVGEKEDVERVMNG